MYPELFNRPGWPRTPDAFTPRRGESQKDTCLRCCSGHGFAIKGSICAFNDIEPTIDECDMKCGDAFKAAFLQVRSKTKIVHEVFEALAKRDSKVASVSE